MLVDLQGPKIRLARSSGPGRAADGDRFTITTEESLATSPVLDDVPVLADDVEPGDRILIDDGRVVLVAEEVTEIDVVCRVTVGGSVANHKGINLPGVAVSMPALTEKDVEDLRWALHLRADVIALSFVRSADDIERVHAVMAEEGVRLPVIAKIEKPEAVEQLEDVIDAFDAIMVARGDLGVELALEEVPVVQKLRSTGPAEREPSIVATQMLESMISDPRPTRAEASDVANAVLDGADAVMLSGETSIGRYPIGTVQTMARIVEHVEEDGSTSSRTWTGRRGQGGAIQVRGRRSPTGVEAKFLVAFTQSGDTARRIARYRTAIPLLAFTPVASVSAGSRHLGRRDFLVPSVDQTDDMVRQVDRRLLELGRSPGRPDRDRRRQPTRHRRFDQRPPRPPDGRRHRRPPRRSGPTKRHT